MPAKTINLCPFCQRVQPPQPAEPWRCPGCNLHLTRRMLLGEGDQPSLDAVSRDYCPWCAFPVAQEQSLPEDEAFACPGCSGSLTVDMLETQVAIDAYRHRSISGLAYGVFALVAVVVIIVTWSFLLG
jgi:hypothetical protein